MYSPDRYRRRGDEDDEQDDDQYIDDRHHYEEPPEDQRRESKRFHTYRDRRQDDVDRTQERKSLIPYQNSEYATGPGAGSGSHRLDDMEIPSRIFGVDANKMMAMQDDLEQRLGRRVDPNLLAPLRYGKDFDDLVDRQRTLQTLLQDVETDISQTDSDYLRQQALSRLRDHDLRAAGQMYLRDKYSMPKRLSDPVVIGSTVHMRDKGIQRRIVRFANEFFVDARSREMLARLLQRPSFQTLNFNIEEALILKSRNNVKMLTGIGNDPDRRKNGYHFLPFYDFVLTIDSLYAKLVAYDISLRNDYIDPEVINQLKSAIPHPKYIPWDFILAYNGNEISDVEENWVQKANRAANQVVNAAAGVAAGVAAVANAGADIADRERYNELKGLSIHDRTIYDPDLRLLTGTEARAAHRNGAAYAARETNERAYYKRHLIGLTNGDSAAYRPKTGYEYACEEAVRFHNDIMNMLSALDQGLYRITTVEALKFTTIPIGGRYDQHIQFITEHPIMPGFWVNQFDGACKIPTKNTPLVFQPKYTDIKDYPGNYLGRQHLFLSKGDASTAFSTYNVRYNDQDSGRFTVQSEHDDVHGRRAPNDDRVHAVIYEHLHNRPANQQSTNKGIHGGPVGEHVFVVMQQDAIPDRLMARETVTSYLGDSTAYGMGLGTALYQANRDRDDIVYPAEVVTGNGAFRPPPFATVDGANGIEIKTPLFCFNVNYSKDVVPVMDAMHYHPITACPDLRRAFQQSQFGAFLLSGYIQRLQELFKAKLKDEILTYNVSTATGIAHSLAQTDKMIPSCDPATEQYAFFNARGDAIPYSQAMSTDVFSGEFTIDPSVTCTKCVPKRLAPINGAAISRQHLANMAARKDRVGPRGSKFADLEQHIRTTRSQLDGPGDPDSSSSSSESESEPDDRDGRDNDMDNYATMRSYTTSANLAAAAASDQGTSSTKAGMQGRQSNREAIQLARYAFERDQASRDRERDRYDQMRDREYESRLAFKEKEAELERSRANQGAGRDGLKKIGLHALRGLANVAVGAAGMYSGATLGNIANKFTDDRAVRLAAQARSDRAANKAFSDQHREGDDAYDLKRRDDAEQQEEERIDRRFTQSRRHRDRDRQFADVYREKDDTYARTKRRYEDTRDDERHGVKTKQAIQRENDRREALYADAKHNEAVANYSTAARKGRVVDEKALHLAMLEQQDATQRQIREERTANQLQTAQYAQKLAELQAQIRTIEANTSNSVAGQYSGVDGSIQSKSTTPQKQ
jgi:hypothetical protein